MLYPVSSGGQQVRLTHVDWEVGVEQRQQLGDIQTQELLGLTELSEVLTNVSEHIVFELGQTEGVRQAEDVTAVLKIKIGVEISRTLRYN